MSDEPFPFGRQPGPVAVQLFGEQVDIEYWIGQLMQRAEFKGDMTQRTAKDKFTIFPRANND